MLHTILALCKSADDPSAILKNKQTLISLDITICPYLTTGCLEIVQSYKGLLKRYL